MKLFTHVKSASAILSLVIASSTSSFAIPTLLLSSDGGMNWSTAVGSADGGLSYSGFIGGSWSVTVNASTALSPGDPNLLDVVAISRNPGRLILRFFETGLTLDAVNSLAKMQANGRVTDSAALVLNTYIDPSNQGFLTIPGTAVRWTGQTVFGQFEETVNSPYTPRPTDQFSLMVEATIILRGTGGATTFSQSLVAPADAPDGGSTLALLGAALVGIGCLSRSRTVKG